MDKRTKSVLIGAGILLLLGTGVGIIFLHQPSQSAKVVSSQSGNVIAKNILVYTTSGVVTVYDTGTGKQLGAFDLKTLGTGKTWRVPVATTVVAPPKSRSVETYKDFIQVPVTIKKGDTAWDIQKRLTPHSNTMEMLGFVSDVNNGKKLDPVYPGDVRVFLEEKVGSPSGDSEVAVRPTVVHPPAQVVSQPNQSAFLYYSSGDYKTLYAYSRAEEALYAVTFDGGELRAKTVLTLKDVRGVTDFKVVNDELYLLQQGKISKVNLTDAQDTQTFALKGAVDEWDVKGGYLYYMYGSSLSKVDTSSGSETDISIGDTAVGYTFNSNKLYVLTKFGSEVNNSVLMKVDPNSLKVDNILETKSSQNEVISDSASGEIYISQVDRARSSSKQVKATDEILPVDPQSLTSGDLIDGIPFMKDALETGGYVYGINGNKLSIYSSSDGSLATSINLSDGNGFMPLK